MSPPFSRLIRQYLPLLILIPCLGAVAIGLARSPILGETLWSPMLTRQVLLLFSGFIVAALGAYTFASRYRRSLELALALVLTAFAAILCGPAPVFVVLFFLLSSWCLGAVVLSGFGRRLNDVPDIATLVVGWALYAVLFSMLAPVPINTTATHTVILGVPILMAGVCAPLRARLRAGIDGLVRMVPTDTVPSRPFLAGLIVSATILSLHLAMVALPERYYDAMTSHLYIPTYMSAHRAWSYDASTYAFAYMPAGADFLYAHMFLLGGETAARLLNFTAFLFTCIATLLIAMRATSRAAAAWAVVLLVSIPLTLIESATLFVENTVSLFIIVAVLVLIQGRSKFSLAHYCAVILLLAGASVVKLHGVIAAAPIGLLALAFCLSRSLSLQRMAMISAITVAGAAAAAWPYAYAWVKTGNPVLPLFNQIFKSPYFPPVELLDSRWTDKLSPWFLYEATFYSTRFVEAYGGALGFGFLVFLAAGLAAAIVGRNRVALLCGCLGLGLIALLAAKIQYLRYLLIFFPLLTVVVAAALGHFAGIRVLRAPLALLIVAVTALNVYKLPAGGWILGVSDLRACCSPNARRDLEVAQTPERIVNRIVNDAAGPMARVLYMNNPYGGLLTGTAISTAWYNTKFAAAFASVATDSEFSALMRQVSPTHVVVDTRVARPMDKLAAAFAAAHGNLMVRVGGLELYQLRPDRAALLGSEALASTAPN